MIAPLIPHQHRSNSHIKASDPRHWPAAVESSSSTLVIGSCIEFQKPTYDVLGPPMSRPLTISISLRVRGDTPRFDTLPIAPAGRHLGFSYFIIHEHNLSSYASGPLYLDHPSALLVSPASVIFISRSGPATSIHRQTVLLPCCC